jgi:hypothetical protein
VPRAFVPMLSRVVMKDCDGFGRRLSSLKFPRGAWPGANRQCHGSPIRRLYPILFLNDFGALHNPGARERGWAAPALRTLAQAEACAANPMKNALARISLLRSGQSRCSPCRSGLPAVPRNLRAHEIRASRPTGRIRLGTPWLHRRHRPDAGSRRPPDPSQLPQAFQ